MADDSTVSTHIRAAIQTGPHYPAPQPRQEGGGEPEAPKGDKQKLIAYTIVLALILAICEFPLGTYLSTPEPYVGTNKTLDGQKDVTLGLVATSTAASTAVSLVPGDAGTPIANQLADLSGKLMVVLAIIYLEKFLLTTFGFVALRIFVPIGLGLLIAYVWTPSERGQRRVMLVWGLKLVVVGVALVTLVPVSTWLTDRINTQYQTSQQAEQTIEETNAASEDASKKNDSQNSDENQNKSFLESLKSSIMGGVDALASGAKNAASSVGENLNRLIDTVAVIIVTSCLVPLAVLLLYFWLIKLFTGADLTGYVTKASNAASSNMRRIMSDAHTATERYCESRNDEQGW